MASDAVVIRSAKDVVALINSGVGKGPSFWILLIALGGVLTDAYDLISFGIGVPQVTREFHLTPAQVGALSASLSFGAIFGAWFGGYFIDKIGRLRMFMLDLVFFVVSAIGAGLAPDALWLFAFRFLMGLGIGLDYPVALSFVAEYSAMRQKAVNVAAWITVSASCYVAFYLLVVLPLYLLGTGPNLWRWAVGLGALPASIVLVLRYIHMRESPMWVALQGDLHEAARILEQSYGVRNVSVEAASPPPTRSYSLKDYGRIFSGKYLKRTILISIICPLQSMLFFAIVFYLPTISLLVFGPNFINAIVGSAFFNAFGIIGGIFAAYAMPVLGLRRLLIYSLCVVVSLLVILWGCQPVSADVRRRRPARALYRGLSGRNGPGWDDHGDLVVPDFHPRRRHRLGSGHFAGRKSLRGLFFPADARRGRPRQNPAHSLDRPAHHPRERPRHQLGSCRPGHRRRGLRPVEFWRGQRRRNACAPRLSPIMTGEHSARVARTCAYQTPPPRRRH